VRDRGGKGWQRWQRCGRGRPGSSNDTARPESVTNASAPQAANDIVLFSSEGDGTRLEEIVDASAPAAVLPLSRGSGTAI